jgi:hypothetical protein
MYKNPPTPEPVMDLWKVKAGDAKVEIYDCSRGAAWYIVKIFPYEGASYDLGGLDSFTGSSPSGHQAVQ